MADQDNTFFLSWRLWQKMTFVLGCAIVVTVFIGFIKVVFDRHRLRKYTRADKGKAAETPEMLEAQPVTVASFKDDIPFGVRAIEHGVEVEGVWISRSNTPVGSSRASLSSEPMRSFNASQLELPIAAIYGSSRNSSGAPSTFDRAVSAERLPNASRTSSPGRGPGNAAPRCAHCNHCIAPGSVAPEPGSTSSTPSPPLPPHYPRESAKSSRRTSDESDYMAMHLGVPGLENAYIRQDAHPELDLMQSHRMSHVAETGQLTPRVRKSGLPADYAYTSEGQVQTIHGVDYFVPQKSPSPPLPSPADREEAISAATCSKSQIGRAISNVSRQPLPLTESYAPKAAYYPDAYQPRGPQHQYSYDDVPYEVPTDQNQRDSQVLRKVNEGFEILRPGTFQTPTSEELEALDKKQGKKLQKKRRNSEDSRRSTFVEQV